MVTDLFGSILQIPPNMLQLEKTGWLAKAEEVDLNYKVPKKKAAGTD